jgi:hypothetical protein
MRREDSRFIFTQSNREHPTVTDSRIQHGKRGLSCTTGALR